MPPKKQQIPAPAVSATAASSAKKRKADETNGKQQAAKDRQSGVDLFNQMQAMRQQAAAVAAQSQQQNQIGGSSQATSSSRKPVTASPGRVPTTAPATSRASGGIEPTPKRRGRPTKEMQAAKLAAAAEIAGIKQQPPSTFPKPQMLPKTPIAAPTAQTMTRTPITGGVNYSKNSDLETFTESVAKRRRTDMAHSINKSPAVLAPVVSSIPNSGPQWNVATGQYQQQVPVHNQQLHYHPGIPMQSQTPPRPLMQQQHQQNFVPIFKSQEYPLETQPATTTSSTSVVATSTGMKAPFGSPVPESVLRRRRSSTAASIAKKESNAVPIMTTTVKTSKSILPPSAVATSSANGTTTTRTTTIKKTTIKQTTTNNDPSSVANVTKSPTLTTTTTTVSTTPRASSMMAPSIVPVPVMSTVSTTTTTIEPSQPPSIHREGKTEAHERDNLFDHEEEHDDDDSVYSNEDDDNSIEDGEIRSIIEDLLPGREKNDAMDNDDDDDDDVEEPITWQGEVEKVLMPIASMIVILIVLVIFISSLLASFFFVRCIGTTVVAFLEGSHGSNDTSWLSAVQNCCNKTANEKQSTIAEKTLPPCFYDHNSGAVPAFTDTMHCMITVDSTQVYAPCPVGGICTNGLLEECIAYGIVSHSTDDKKVTNFLQKSTRNDSCQLSDAGLVQINKFKLLLDDWTFVSKCGTGYAECNITSSSDIIGASTGSNTCRLSLPPTTKMYNTSLSIHPLFRLDDAIQHLSLSFDEDNAFVSILDIVSSSIDMFVLSKESSEQEKNKVKTKKVDTIQYMVGLHTAAPTKRTPCSCRCKILLKWVLTSMLTTIWQSIVTVLLGFWHLYSDAPMVSTLVLVGGTSLAAMITFVRTKRLEKLQLEENVIYLRQRVCAELSDHSTVAIPIHLVLERIIWIDFPSNRKRRQYLSNAVWPYVVIDIRSDLRIAKTTQQLQTATGSSTEQIYEHWQWIDPISFSYK